MTKDLIKKTKGDKRTVIYFFFLTIIEAMKDLRLLQHVSANPFTINP
jgi:hypothetical protein